MKRLNGAHYSSRYTLPPHTRMQTPCPEPPTPGCCPLFCYSLNDPDSKWSSTHTELGPLVIGRWTSPARKSLNMSLSYTILYWFSLFTVMQQNSVKWKRKLVCKWQCGLVTSLSGFTSSLVFTSWTLNFPQKCPFLVRVISKTVTLIF